MYIINLKAQKSLISKLLHLSKLCYFIQFFERPPLYGALARKVYPVKPEMGFCCPRQFLDFQKKKIWVSRRTPTSQRLKDHWDPCPSRNSRHHVPAFSATRNRMYVHVTLLDRHIWCHVFAKTAKK